MLEEFGCRALDGLGFGGAVRRGFAVVGELEQRVRLRFGRGERSAGAVDALERVAGATECFGFEYVGELGEFQLVDIAQIER